MKSTVTIPESSAKSVRNVPVPPFMVGASTFAITSSLPSSQTLPCEQSSLTTLPRASLRFLFSVSENLPEYCENFPKILSAALTTLADNRAQFSTQTDLCILPSPLHFHPHNEHRVLPLHHKMSSTTNPHTTIPASPIGGANLGTLARNPDSPYPLTCTRPSHRRVPPTKTVPVRSGFQHSHRPRYGVGAPWMRHGGGEGNINEAAGDADGSGGGGKEIRDRAGRGLARRRVEASYGRGAKIYVEYGVGEVHGEG